MIDAFVILDCPTTKHELVQCLERNGLTPREPIETVDIYGSNDLYVVGIDDPSVRGAFAEMSEDSPLPFDIAKSTIVSLSASDPNVLNRMVFAISSLSLNSWVDNDHGLTISIREFHRWIRSDPSCQWYYGDKLPPVVTASE